MELSAIDDDDDDEEEEEEVKEVEDGGSDAMSYMVSV